MQIERQKLSLIIKVIVHPKNVVIIYMLFRIGILVIKQLLVAIDFHGMVVWGENTMEVNSLKNKTPSKNRCRSNRSFAMSKRNLSIQTHSTDHLLSQPEPKILKLIHVPNLNRNDSVVHIIPKENKKYSLKLLSL